MKITKVMVYVIFAAAIAIRLADTFRPIDHASWREADLGSISRNYVREGMNPFYPRVDWRGTGPGYAEMEFPLYPYLIAVTYEIFGIHDVTGRLWAFAFSVATLFFFFKLARENLGRFTSIAAFAMFAFNPLVLESSTSIQPEGLMICSYVAAAVFFLRWIRDDRNRDFWFALAATTLVLLAKATAAHLGLLFAILLYQKYGFGVLSKPKVWLFGFLSLLPAAAWYIHAKGLWTAYGNSLGVSNEYHWIGPDFLTNPYFITGILRIELLQVWLIFGLVVAAFGLIWGARERIAVISVVWFAAIFVFYVVASRTTADDWASYYHIFSVPPAALLFGFGLKKLGDLLKVWADNFSRHSVPGNLLRLGFAAIFVFAAVSVFLVEAKRARAELLGRRVADVSLSFAGELKPVLRPDGLLLISGGNCVDADGYRVAYNVSFMFYWLDRKGANICVQEQSIEKVRGFAATGYTYFIAQRSALKEKPGFENELIHSYPVIAGSDVYEVFDLAARN
jgi:hypothetical protein